MVERQPCRLRWQKARAVPVQPCQSDPVLGVGLTLLTHDRSSATRKPAKEEGGRGSGLRRARARGQVETSRIEAGEVEAGVQIVLHVYLRSSSCRLYTATRSVQAKEPS